MISIITATYGTNRVDKIIELHHQIVDTATVPIQHIIVVDGNQETYDKLAAKHVLNTDIYLLPRNIEWTRATNIGEKFAKYPYICSVDDDSLIETPDMFKKAVDIFNQKFPNGIGVLGFSNGESCCPEWMTTRRYAYSNNLNHFIWPEYWHEGDYETFLKASQQGCYTWSSELQVRDEKFKDYSRGESLKCVEHDQPLLKHRQQLGFPNIITTVQRLPINQRIEYLEKNYYNE